MHSIYILYMTFAFVSLYWYNHRFPRGLRPALICSFCYFWICLIKHKRTCKTRPHPCTTWGCRGCHQSCFAAHGSGTAALQCCRAPRCAAQSRPPGTGSTHLRQYRVNKTLVESKGHKVGGPSIFSISSSLKNWEFGQDFEVKTWGLFGRGIGTWTWAWQEG